jgi:tetratricopeptide (TPR) repeat protein
MPPSSELPDDLKLLARRNALEVGHNRFNADFGRLVTAIEGVLEKADAGREQREETPRPTVTTQGERRARAAITRGNASYNKKEYDKAISDYNEAIRLDPNQRYLKFSDISPIACE